MDYVTQEQCEERRRFIEEKFDKKYDELTNVQIDVSAMRSDIKPLTFILKWWLGILSSLIAGVSMWLVTR
jgi:hypothetical protein